MENLSLLIATLTPLVIGYIWFGLLFKKIWRKSAPKAIETLTTKHKIAFIVISIITSFIMSFFLLEFNNSEGQEGEHDTFLHGAFHGLVLSVFIIIPILTGKKLYEQTSWINLGLNVFYWLTTLVIMGGTLDVMNHWS